MMETERGRFELQSQSLRIESLAREVVNRPSDIYFVRCNSASLRLD